MRLLWLRNPNVVRLLHGLANGDIAREETLSIVWNAHVMATGKQLPDGAFAIRYPELDSTGDFDFDDQGEMTRRLPRLTALYLE
ncbi:hypothetical protein ACIHCX_10480 [Streptomyces sp. NPDC052043]|uniref:hypothetical protein n=1 Tax=Streptomyces sp. NPDC052043 TaxID=3365684 RepID=UPI0037CF25BA